MKSAFDKIKAGLEDAAAFAQGNESCAVVLSLQANRQSRQREEASWGRVSLKIPDRQVR
jgi:hypothetical protein